MFIRKWSRSVFDRISLDTKMRMLNYGMIIFCSVLALLPGHKFVSVIDWILVGWWIRQSVDFERTCYQERLERLTPWYSYVIQIRWLLAVSRNLPAYQRLYWIYLETARLRNLTNRYIEFVEVQRQKEAQQ